MKDLAIALREWREAEEVLRDATTHYHHTRDSYDREARQEAREKAVNAFRVAVLAAIQLAPEAPRMSAE